MSNAHRMENKNRQLKVRRAGYPKTLNDNFETSLSFSTVRGAVRV